MSESREQQVRHFEELAEWLAAEQLDLLAQLEAQLRAVHHTMRRIATLRSKEHRRGTEDEPTDGERKLALNGLAGEIQGLDEHVNTQAECCQAMLRTVAKMQRRLSEMKESGLVSFDGAEGTSPSDATE
jgi:chromosome segregation ATPase